MSKLPILVTFYNRPEILERLLINLKNFDNVDIFFAHDYGASNFDQQKVMKSRSLINKYFPDTPKNHIKSHSKHLGCKLGMKLNIDWFFTMCKNGVILEDDCIPSEKFIIETRRLLKTYENSEKIMMISGFQPLPPTRSSKFFNLTLFPSVWGWATWSHKWKLYDLKIQNISNLVYSIANKLYPNDKIYIIQKQLFIYKFKKIFLDVNNNLIDTWDYSLLASMWNNEMFGLVFPSNQVINIGFGPNATHTKRKLTSKISNSINVLKLGSPLDLNLDIDSERWIVKNVHKVNLYQFLKSKLKVFFNI